MKNITRTVVTFEAWQQTVVSRQNGPVSGKCSYCKRETTMFTPNEFARLQGLTPRELFRGIEAGNIHFIEKKDGSLLICGDSTKNQIIGEQI